MTSSNVARRIDQDNDDYQRGPWRFEVFASPYNGESRVSQRGVPTPEVGVATYHLADVLPKNAWKWKILDPKVAGRIPSTPLDQPMPIPIWGSLTEPCWRKWYFRNVKIFVGECPFEAIVSGSNKSWDWKGAKTVSLCHVKVLSYQWLSRKVTSVKV